MMWSYGKNPIRVHEADVIYRLCEVTQTKELRNRKGAVRTARRGAKAFDGLRLDCFLQQISKGHDQHSTELETAHPKPDKQNLKVHWCTSKFSRFYLGSRSH